MPMFPVKGHVSCSFLGLPEIKSAWAYRLHGSIDAVDDSMPAEQRQCQSESCKPPLPSHQNSQRGFGSMFFMRGSSSTGSLGPRLGFGSGIDIARNDSTSSAASLPMPDPQTPRADTAQLEVVTELPDEHPPQQPVQVCLADASFTWVKDGEGHAATVGGLSMAFAQGLLVQPTLSCISVRIVPSSLTVVTGSPGAGEGPSHGSHCIQQHATLLVEQCMQHPALHAVFHCP